MRKMILLPLLILLTSICAGSEYVYKPKMMRVFIGGFDETSHEITYDGRTLNYYEADNMFLLKKVKPIIVEVTKEKWNVFYDNLQDIKIWEWKDSYENPDVVDGTVWDVTIVYSIRGKTYAVSSGSNAYPEKFKEFLWATRQLINGRSFK